MSGISPVGTFVRPHPLVGFVTSFRDGQIDLNAFRSGPSFLHDPEGSEDDLMSLLFDQSPRRGKKRRRAAARPPDDCPF
jgi:hypothetical protein